MIDEQRRRRRTGEAPPADATLPPPRTVAADEEAPVEAVRAIAALLGRAAAPRRRTAPTTAPATAWALSWANCFNWKIVIGRVRWRTWWN